MYYVDVMGNEYYHDPDDYLSLEDAKACGLPYKIDEIVGAAFCGDVLGAASAAPGPQLHPNLVAEIVGDLDHVAHARPGLVSLAEISKKYIENFRK